MISLILTPVFSLLALQFPWVQSKAAQQAAKVLSNKLNTEVAVKKVTFLFFNKLILGDVFILSTPTDTLLNVQKLSITLAKTNPFSKDVALKKVLLQGGFFHLAIEDGQTNLERVFHIERGGPKDSTSSAWLISLNELSLKDFRVTFTDLLRSRKGTFPTTIDFLDFDLSQVDLNVQNICFKNDTLSCTLKNLNGIEKSGYPLHKLSGLVTVSGSVTEVRDLVIQDPWSDVRADFFLMHYNSARCFKTFVDSVRLEAHFANALLSMQSLACYAPAINGNSVAVTISGPVDGPVRYLKSNGLTIRSANGASSLDCAIRIKGLPDVSTTTAFVDINRLTSHVGDFAQILSQINGTDPSKIIQMVPPTTQLHLEGRLAGLLTNFVANGTLSTDLGALHFDSVLYQDNEKGFHIHGFLGAEELNLASIAGKTFGSLTMHSHTHTTLRSAAQGGMEAVIDTLFIDKAVVNGYPFSNISATGFLKNQRFNGHVTCNDPNLRFQFDGLANLNYRESRQEQITNYVFNAEIFHADLSAIGIDSRDSISRLSGNVIANFRRANTGDIFGFVEVKKAEYANSSGSYNVGAIYLSSQVQDSSYRFELIAPFATASYTGSEGVTTFIKDIKNHTLSRHLSNHFAPQEIEEAHRKYRLTITIHDMLAMGQLALPGLYMAPGTQLSTTFTSNDQLSCTLRSKYIRYNQQRVSNIFVDLTGDTLSLQSTISGTDIQVFGQLIDTMHLHVHGAQNRVDTRLHYANYTGDNRGGAFNAYFNFLETPQGEIPEIELNLLPSQFMVNGSQWELDPSSILFAHKEMLFKEVKLHHNTQSLTCNGFLSKERSDTLYVTLHQFDLSITNLFFKETPYRFSGSCTGDAKVIDFYQNRQFSLSLLGKDLFVNDWEAGELNITCLWDHLTQQFLIKAQNVQHSTTPLTATGTYQPNSKNLNLNASLDHFPVHYFEPFLSTMIADLEGGLSGTLNLKGTLPNLSLTSNNLHANNVDFTVHFTKVPYTLDGLIVLKEDGFSVQNAILSDRYGNKGVVNGGMGYRSFRDITIDASVDFTNMLCLSTKEKDNSSFYGDAFATGRLHAFGNLNQVTLDIWARSEKNTSIHIPLSTVYEAKQSTLLTFATPSKPLLAPVLDPLDTLRSKETSKTPTQVAVLFNATVTPDAELLIEIDKTTGNIISGFGDGNITMNIDPSKSLFDITGDYYITNGDYQFVLQSVYRRKFYVIPGGRITFYGDILKTNLDLTAAYRTKTSINTLLTDNSGIATIRDVECQIRMAGNMMNPNLVFNIEVPDLAPETRSKVQAALTPEDKMVRQFMALLITGNFLPDQLSGIVNNTSILYSNASEILSNQVNNILGQLNLPLDVDVGFNYLPGEKGRDIYDAAISMQLFNKRVVVNGNVGNTQTVGTTGDVGGNIDIEVKITDNGNLRVKAFSHVADQYSTFSDLGSSQRNGGGITYQEEFNSFRELVKRVFRRRNVR